MRRKRQPIFPAPSQNQVVRSGGHGNAGHSQRVERGRTTNGNRATHGGRAMRAGVRHGNCHGIAERERHHDRMQGVEAVIAPPDDREGQIQLGRGEPEHAHAARGRRRPGRAVHRRAFFAPRDAARLRADWAFAAASAGDIASGSGPSATRSASQSSTESV